MVSIIFAAMIWLILLLGPSSPIGQTRAENRAAAIALHRRMDVNHDGYVTFDEVRATANSMVAPGNLPAGPADDVRLVRAQFDKADANHDGRISLSEAVKSADRAFSKADTDHNGILSPQERGAYAARAIVAMQAEMAGWKAPPCQPGAACAIARGTREGKGATPGRP